MNRLPVSHPALDYALVRLRGRHARLQEEGLDRGASAVEWVVISMIVVGIVIAVGALLYQALKSKANSVGTCIQGANATSNAPCSN